MGAMVDEPQSNWIDGVLADSFPASDPPSWAPGMARPAPIGPSDTEAADHAPSPMLEPGDLMPHFDVAQLEDGRFEYASIWQRRNLVLVTLPTTGEAAARHGAWSAARLRASTDDTTWVLTSDRVAGAPYPGVVVADRWGEVVHIAHAPLPSPEEVARWVHALEMRCPECEGEAK